MGPARDDDRRRRAINRPVRVSQNDTGCDRAEPELNDFEKVMHKILPLPLAFVLECKDVTAVDDAVYAALIKAKVEQDKGLQDMCAFAAQIAMYKIKDVIDLSKDIGEATEELIIKACSAIEKPTPKPE